MPLPSALDLVGPRPSDIDIGNLGARARKTSQVGPKHAIGASQQAEQVGTTQALARAPPHPLHAPPPRLIRGPRRAPMPRRVFFGRLSEPRRIELLREA